MIWRECGVLRKENILGYGVTECVGLGRDAMLGYGINREFSA